MSTFRKFLWPAAIMALTVMSILTFGVRFSDGTSTVKQSKMNSAEPGAVSKEKTIAAENNAAMKNNDTEAPMAIATFGAGCFWGVEAAFRQIEGVTATSVGYAGGKTEEPSYSDVCTGQTGHAEVVRVEYDPSRVSYEQLLSVFWENHDPTTMNRQGPDVGEQYRSVIFYHSPEQKAAAEQSKAALDKGGKYRNPVVTQIEEAGPYYPAEDYHQQYLEKRGLSTCRIK
jgi:peptide-methionine (S)-S-oxide reductase